MTIQKDKKPFSVIYPKDFYPTTGSRIKRVYGLREEIGGDVRCFVSDLSVRFEISQQEKVKKTRI